jgi:FtsZ-binding cell division protein ZapB
MAVKCCIRYNTHDNSEYLLNENARLRRELVVTKQQVEHLAVENQRLLSQNSNTTEWQSTMLDELGPMEDTMA